MLRKKNGVEKCIKIKEKDYKGIHYLPRSGVAIFLIVAFIISDYVFISNLKTIRKERQITQEKLAELCNTDTAYIGQIETKKRFPSLTFIEKTIK